MDLSPLQFKPTVRRKGFFIEIKTEKMARRPARCYRYCKNKVSFSTRPTPPQLSSLMSRKGLFRAVLTAGPWKIALSKIAFQPWCPRPQDSHLRSGPKACQCRRIPPLRPHGFERVRAALLRSSRSRPYLRQQVCVETLWFPTPQTECSNGVFDF